MHVINIDLHRDCVRILFDVKNDATLRVRRINDAVAIYLGRLERRADEMGHFVRFVFKCEATMRFYKTPRNRIIGAHTFHTFLSGVAG